MIGWFEALCRDVRRRLSRSELSLRLLGLTKERGKETEPGLLLIQIDGLSRKQMEQAMKSGRLPFLRWLREREHYDTRTFYSGLPSSTPGVQGELFYGEKCAVPAFSFMDRKTKKVTRMFRQDSAVQVESELQEKAEGLLKDGSSYCNIYRGGAKESHFCAPDLGWGEAVKAPALWRIVVLAAIHFWSVARLLALGVVEFVLALIDFFRGLIQGQDLWKELKFIPTRVGICILVREMMVVGGAVDLARGLPVIHMNFLGYDEQAHRRGPTSAFAHWTLLGIDDTVKRLYRAAMRSPNRDYTVWVFSDHGQEETVSYEEVAGKPLAEKVKEIFSELGESTGSIGSEPGVQDSRAAWLGMPRQKKSQLAKPSPVVDEPEVVVAAMGPVGHIYCSGKCSEAEKRRRASLLVSEGKVPLVLYLTENGEVAGVSTECETLHLPAEAEQIFGGKHPLGEQVGVDLAELVAHPNAGDLVVFGWRRTGQPISFPVENGAHAGPGFNETQGFVLMPPGTPVEQADSGYIRPKELRAAALHHLKREHFSPHVRSVRQTPAEKGALKIMTYNIHRCLGLDARISPERIARVIAQQQPDIVALQEVDVGRKRSFGVDQAQVIADQLFMKYHFYPAHEIEDEKYGLAVLSHFPLHLVRSGPLPGLDHLPDLEPRGAQWVTIECGGRRIHLVNTHLGLRGKERRRQVEAILGDEWLGSLDKDEPLVICGDLNAIPRSFVHRRISTHFSDVQHVLANHRPLRTFYGRYPLSRIDHVFISEHFEARRVRVARTSLTRVASDHLPLFTEVVLRDDSRKK